MVLYLFLFMVALPLLEILILVRIGQATALWVPFAIVIFTGAAGTMLARWQGMKTLERLRDEIRAGRVPGDALMDAFLVLVAGILFVLPGVLTDVAAICLLIPPVRAQFKRIVR